MKKTTWILAGLAGIVLLSGCVNQTPPLITKKGGNSVKPQPQNVAFRVTDASVQRNEYSAEVVMKTEGRLIEDRFVSLKAGELDMDVLIPCRILIDTTLEEIDHMGEFYVFNARANVTVTATDENHTLDWGKKQFSLQGARTLGQGAAMRDATGRLADEVAKWVTSGCSAKRDQFTKFRASAAFQGME